MPKKQRTGKSTSRDSSPIQVNHSELKDNFSRNHLAANDQEEELATPMSDQGTPASPSEQPQWHSEGNGAAAQYTAHRMPPIATSPQWEPGPVPPPVMNTTDGGLQLGANGQRIGGEHDEYQQGEQEQHVQVPVTLEHESSVDMKSEENEKVVGAHVHADPAGAASALVGAKVSSLSASGTSTPKKAATPKRASALTEEEIQRRVNEQLEKRVQEAMAARLADQESKKKAEEQRKLQAAEDARLQAIREEEERVQAIEAASMRKKAENERIEALVQQRLADQQRQAEEEEAARIQAEEDRKLAEQLAQKAKEEEEQARQEKELRRKKEEDDKAAALQAMIDKRVQEELQKRMSSTPQPDLVTGGNSPAAAPLAGDDETDSSDFENSDDRVNTTTTILGDPFDSTFDAGIFAPCNDGEEVERQQLSQILEGEMPMLGYEGRFEEEKEHETGKCVTQARHPAFTVSHYASTREREEGRCLQPSHSEEHHRPVDNHQSMMLGHFTSKQTVVMAVNTLPGRLNIVPRERKTEGKMSVSDATFVFEKDSANMPADEMTDGSLEQHVSPDEMVADPSKASQDLYNRMTYPDAIQYWEHTKGNPPPFTVGGGTLTKVWTYDYEPRKMSPLQSQYNDGTLLEVQVKRMAPSLQSLLGNNCDPLFMSMAVYTFNGNTLGKCSETFYSDYWTEEFYPAKKPHPANRLKSFTTFVPTKVRSQPLFLIVRLYRLASADFNDYTDLYVRTAKYNSKHLTDYKQKMMMTANHSEFTQEFAWTMMPLNVGGKLSQGDLVAEKMWLSKKTLGDNTSVIEFLNLPEVKKNKAPHILCNVVVNLIDVSKDEVSFPKHGPETSALEEETVISLLNTEQMRAQRRQTRHCPYRMMSLGGAFFNSYANVMYVRLHNFTLGKTSNADLNTKTLTIAVQIALKEHDDNPAEIGLPAVYGRSMAESIVLHSGWSNVTVGAKDCEFHDEFKIQLPLNLTERHHLFFTFWGIPLKKGDKWVKIGHSFLPIFAGSTLLVKEQIPLPVVTPEGMQQVPAGYLVRSAQLNPGMLLQGGNPCFSLSTLCRSSVYSTNPVTSSFHSRMPMAIRELIKDQGVFATSGTAGHLSSPVDQAHQSLISNFHEIPFSEQLGQFPMFANFLLSFVASKSTTVGIHPRASALKVLLDMINKIHSWESNAYKKPRGAAADAGKATIIRTSPMVWLYLFFTNRLLYTSEEFPVYAAIPEVICLELSRSSGSKTLLALADLIWFTLDLILRSLYLFMDPERRDPTTGKKLEPHVIDETFYKVLKDFVTVIIGKLVHQGGQSLASRMTVFLRQLLRVCDRGQIMSIAEGMLKQLVGIGLTPNVHSSMRIFMESDQAVMWSLPSPLVRRPQFFLRMCFNVLVPHLMLKARDHRSTASTMIYQFLHAATHNPNHGGTDLSGLGNAAFELTEIISSNWGIFKQQDGKGTETQTSVNDKRQLLVTAMWGLSKQSPVLLKQWIREVAGSHPKKNPLAGLLFMLNDAVTTFRYSAGRDKKDLRLLRREEKEVKLPGPQERAQADARFSTFVCLLTSRVASLVLDEAHALLTTVKEDNPHPVCSLYLDLLQNVCNTDNSFTALEAGVVLLYKTHVNLFPEFISRKAKHGTGMALIAIKLMSVGARSVRALATRTYLSIAQHHYEVLGSLSKLKHYTASALVQVSEQSDSRNMTRAGDYIQSALKQLCGEIGTCKFPKYDEAYLRRYTSVDQEAGNRSPSGTASSGLTHSQECTTAILSFDPFVESKKLEGYQQDAKSQRDGQDFAQQFTEMCQDMGTLLTDVVQMQADDSMKLQQVKTSAYRQICATFLRQNSLVESLKWYSKLRDSHNQNKDYVEAGLTSVYMAAIGFRVTSLFYSVNGTDAPGCKIPPAFFTHVFWHHFTRLLPQLEEDLSIGRIHSMVRDLSTLPEDRCFRLEGQSQLMHEAATSFAKAQHYELSFIAIRAVDAIAEGMNDFEALLQVHDAMKTWSHAMNEGKKSNNWRKRVSCKYYFLRAHGGGITAAQQEREGEGGERGVDGGFQRIYRMNQATTMETFQNFTRGVLSAAVPDQAHIFFDDGFGNLSDYNGRALQGTSKQRAALVEGRCIACCYEVQPVAEDEYLDGSAPMSMLHQTVYYKRFHHFSRIHADSKLPIPENPKQATRGAPGQAAVHPATPEITKDVTKHMMQTQEHLVHTGFPSIVSCDAVVKTEKKSMDCYQTAIMTVQDRLWKLQETTPETYLSILVNTMSPLGYQPPGTYYKAVLETMGSNKDVLAITSQYILLAKDKLAAIEKQMMTKQPDTYASLIQGVVNMECTLQIVQAAYEEHGEQEASPNNSSTNGVTSAGGH